MLQHVNLGACSIEELPYVFTGGMFELCRLHSTTGVGDTGQYLPPEIDKQVGLGMLGLANFLAIHDISYEEFGDALEAVLANLPVEKTRAWEAAKSFELAFIQAASVARAYGMERALTIAPTASCSYRYLDTRGFTTTPEIAPPIAREVDRDSETMGVESFDYGDVETASEVGWPSFKKVADGLVMMMQRTGMFHGYSMNSWSDMVVYDEQFLYEWLQSPQTSLYYALQVQENTQAKDDVGVELGGDFTSFFNMEEAVEEPLAAPDYCSRCAE